MIVVEPPSMDVFRVAVALRDAGDGLLALSDLPAVALLPSQMVPPLELESRRDHVAAWAVWVADRDGAGLYLGDVRDPLGASSSRPFWAVWDAVYIPPVEKIQAAILSMLIRFGATHNTNPSEN